MGELMNALKEKWASEQCKDCINFGRYPDRKTFCRDTTKYIWDADGAKAIHKDADSRGVETEPTWGCDNWRSRTSVKKQNVGDDIIEGLQNAVDGNIARVHVKTGREQPNVTSNRDK